MSKLTCLSCAHWRGGAQRANDLPTNVTCAVLGELKVARYLDMCPSANYEPGVDERESWDESDQ